MNRGRGLDFIKNTFKNEPILKLCMKTSKYGSKSQYEIDIFVSKSSENDVSRHSSDSLSVYFPAQMNIVQYWG